MQAGAAGRGQSRGQRYTGASLQARPAEHAGRAGCEGQFRSRCELCAVLSVTAASKSHENHPHGNITAVMSDVKQADPAMPYA